MKFNNAKINYLLHSMWFNCVETITTDTGFIVEQGNIKGLLEAARRIGEQGKACYQSSCRAYAVKHFNKKERYTDYLHLYDELIARN